MRERRLPPGDGQPDSIEWQPVPGAPGAALYPLIRKIDAISSNSYLITTPDVIILIDPGGLPEQAEHLARVIGTCRAENDRPLFVFLTHAHTDHFVGIQADPAFAHPDTVVFAVQQGGACALESGDTTVTLSDLMQAPFFPMKVGLHLFSQKRPDLCSEEMSFPNGARITITRGQTGPAGLPCERIEFGPGPALVVYYTPGHSPDSVCLQIGELLFTGDLLFAASPGIAGLTGWSQETLIHSLGGVETLIAKGDIQLVYSGHGRAIPAADALRMLPAVSADARGLANIAEMEPDRAARTAAFAGDCMEQVNELFTIMSGRLQYVSFILDELGESGMADQSSTLIRGDMIDVLLEAFHNFAEEQRHGQDVPIHLVLKAGQVIGKLERTFNRDELTTIIDPSLVRRASRLLSDYTTMLRGFTPPNECSNCDLNTLTEAVVTGLTVPPFTDDEVLSSADDDVAFSRILLARIGTPPLLADVEATVLSEGDPLQVCIDREHFTDLLTYILEDLVGTGADRIEISTRRSGRNAIVMVAGNGPSPGTPKERHTWRFLKVLAERAGGILAVNEHGGMQQFEFTTKTA
jgi:glyoxylase-like metal-dependent hydrolase (beta-lactamase superfamily II)